VDWFGADFDGVIVFDESHAMQMPPAARASRRSGRFATGPSGLRLQHALPNAASSMSRLPAPRQSIIWPMPASGALGGEDFPFASRSDFVEAIEAGGVAAMEVLARDLKALGSTPPDRCPMKASNYDLARTSADARADPHL